jgi:hypothetical protein
MATKKSSNSTGTATKKTTTPATKKVAHGSPTFGNNGFDLAPGDNAKFLSFAMNLFNLPALDRKDPQQVSDRINLYFTRCCEADIKPSVAGLANSLGIPRQSVWDIRTGKCLDGFSPESADLVKKAHGILGELWEDYMQNGKVNPVAGIFLGKNHFGYRDQQEVVLTPNNPLGDETSTEEIAKRIAEDTADYIDVDVDD